jgi:hypothetical protein
VGKKGMATKRRSTKAERAAIRLRQIAFHEAGHAVAFLEFGIAKFRYVTIVAEDGNLGHLSPYSSTITKSAAGRLSDREVSRNELHAICLMCGYAAETVLAGAKYNPWMLVLGGGQQDFKDCWEAIEFRFPAWQGYENGEGGDVRGAYWKYIWQRARHFVAVHGTKINAIAEALLSHKKLSYSQCKEIAWAATPSQEHQVRVCRMMGLKETEISEITAKAICLWRSGNTRNSTPMAGAGLCYRRTNKLR